MNFQQSLYFNATEKNPDICREVISNVAMHMHFMVQRAIEDNSYEGIDQLLSNVDADRLSFPSMGALLKNTFTIKHKLPHWYKLRVRCKLRALKANRIDILRGL